jgi:uncharacterized protein
MLHVLIDADALPRAIKDIIFKAVARSKAKWTLVANKRLYIPPELKMDMITVEKSPDEADDRIVSLIDKGDLVITSDIPLADRAIAKGAAALSPKGEFLTERNIKERLATRDLLDQLRNEGAIRCGGAPFASKDSQNFANRLDSFLVRREKEDKAKTQAKPSPFETLP